MRYARTCKSALIIGGRWMSSLTRIERVSMSQYLLHRSGRLRWCGLLYRRDLVKEFAMRCSMMQSGSVSRQPSSNHRISRRQISHDVKSTDELLGVDRYCRWEKLLYRRPLGCMIVIVNAPTSGEKLIAVVLRFKRSLWGNENLVQWTEQPIVGSSTISSLLISHF